MICRPKTEVIEAKITEAVNQGQFLDRTDLAVKVFTIWQTAHQDPATDWRHGTGKKSGSKAPNPDQQNPPASLGRYITGRTAQNKRGWEMFAQLLCCNVDQLVDVEVDGPAKDPAGVEEAMLISSDGDIALRKLANIENLQLAPRDANFVSRSPEALQTLSISGRVLFNSILNEPIVDIDGSEIATVDLELRNAFVILSLSDPEAQLINSAGFSGQERQDGIRLSYHGQHKGKIVVEVASDTPGVSLAGSVANIDNLFDVKAKFRSDDSVSVGFDRNSIISKNTEPQNTSANQSENRLRRAIESQLIERGIADMVFSDIENDIILAARKRFRMDDFS